MPPKLTSYSGHHIRVMPILALSSMGDGDQFCQCNDVALAGDLCVIDNMWLMAAVLDGDMRFK
jgi:NAD(P)H-nitrite reductase large subunit